MDFMTFAHMYTTCLKNNKADTTLADKYSANVSENNVHRKPSTESSLNDLLETSTTCRRKMKLWEETQGMCIYCGKPIVARDFISGVDSDIEHIIPRSLGGYTQMDNLACSCRACNREKGDLTAIDYMLSKDSTSLQRYMHRIRILAISGFISEEKYYNLLHPKHMKIGVRTL